MDRPEKEKGKWKEKWLFRVSLQNLLLIALSVAINYAGRIFAESLSLPFWLDTVGMLIVAIRLGPLAAALSGCITNTIFGIGDVASFAYIIVGLGIGISVGYFFPRGRKREAFPVVATAVFSGVVAVALSTPLNMIFYEGYTGNIWGDGLIDMLSNYVESTLVKSILGEAFVDIPDKALSVILATLFIFIADLIRSFVPKKKTAAAVLLLVMVCVPCFSVWAIDFDADYAGISYSTANGLISAEINAIEQTTDGYIWVGTYSGLYRYDGSSFARFSLDEKMNSVMQLYTDSKKRLWIGTNDSGIACYDPKDGTVAWYDTEKGLSANAIRSICEDSDGNIYVGTIAELCMINDGGGITVFEEWEDINYVRSMAYDGSGGIAGVTNAGILFFMKNRSLIAELKPEEETNDYYSAVASNGINSYLVGTSSNYAYKMNMDGVTVTKTGTVDMGEITYFNRLRYVEEVGGYFFCCENGLGYIDEETDAVTDLSTEDFNSSVSDVIVDYQENVWFVSNKQGIFKLSQNPFADIFAKAHIEEDIVNAVQIKDGVLYIGMDNGLAAVDMATMEQIFPDYIAKFDGVRVRHLLEDAKGNLWVSSYGEDGLVCIAPDGTLTGYNESKNTVGSFFRLALELTDGRILAASTTGLNFITDGVLTGTLGVSDGLPATQVLSMVEDADGAVYLGTDGDGVYVMENDRIVRRIGENEGLESLVILRIVPCTGGYIYVTSNALYYDNKDTIKKLNNFPYSNNYDIYITDNGKAWIFSSAGIYIVYERDLLANEEGYNYTLLNHNKGFHTTLTANAKNAIDGEDVYLCCTDGVKRVSTATYNVFNTNYDIRLSAVIAGDETVPEESGKYNLPAKNGRVEINVAVLNFTLSNPLVRVYLEGMKDEGVTRYQNELVPVYFTNLKYGDYTLHVQILDEADNRILRDARFYIHKEAQIFERLYFKVYLIFVCVMFTLFIGWLVGNVRHYMHKVRGLQRAATTDPMTGLLNKATSEEELAELCLEESGILMMIDLDSFKLVNDLYGHDMGDKVLIRFAELIRDALHSDDLAGRMGGDEFIAFMRSDIDEMSVTELTKYLNEELIKSAKDFMGAEMTIPLGASIGAVFVPDEGKDFSELYRKADKALYSVKQNGKHGYAFFKKASYSQESEASQAETLAGLQMILRERSVGKGAYTIGFEKMQTVYRIFARLAAQYGVHVRIAQLVLCDVNDEKRQVPDEVMEEFEELIAVTLRKSDIVTQMRDGTFLVLLTDLDNAQSGDEVLERIAGQWKQTKNGEAYAIASEAETIGVE